MAKQQNAKATDQRDDRDLEDIETEIDEALEEVDEDEVDERLDEAIERAEKEDFDEVLIELEEDDEPAEAKDSAGPGGRKSARK